MFMLKRFAVLLFSLLMLCSCQNREPDFTETTVAVRNPFTTHETLAEAEEAANITLTLPEELAEWPNVTYRAANNDTLQLIEVIFASEDNEIRLRKSPGAEDNSGIYEEFAIAVESLDGERGLVMKGDGSGLYSLAIWQDGEYSYSISCEEGVPQETLYDWVYAVK